MCCSLRISEMAYQLQKEESKENNFVNSHIVLLLCAYRACYTIYLFIEHD